jgi:hypothetical protein
MTISGRGRAASTFHPKGHAGGRVHRSREALIRDWLAVLAPLIAAAAALLAVVWR